MAKTQNNTAFRRKLRESIREAGKWVQENADQIVNDAELLTGLDIWIRYSAGEVCPEISVNATYIGRGVVEAMNREENDGEETDMETEDQGRM